MKKHIITTYSFDELSEESKQKAIENLYNINVDYDWWEFIYSEAEELGFKIIEFDIDRGSCCKIDIIQDETEIADNIIKNHGETCDTYKLAKSFLSERDNIINSAEKDENGEFTDEYELDQKLDECEADFIKSLSEEYLSMLRREYEFLTSEESIIETIQSNEYEFTSDGKLY